MTEEQVAKLRAAGFSDADINDYAANEGKQAANAGPVNPNAPVSQGLPEVDVTQPSDTLRNAQAAGVATTNPGSMMTDAAAIGSAVAPYVVPTAATGLGLYGAAKVGGWGRNLVNTVGQGINAMNTQSLAAQHAAEGIADRAAVQQGAMTAQEMAQRQAAREAAMNAARGTAQSTAQAAAQQAPQQTARQAMAEKVRQMAAQRIVPAAQAAAVPAAVAAGGVAATKMAGNQMAAMTPEQRRAYYDSMMMGAMSGDAGLAAAIMNRGQ